MPARGTVPGLSVAAATVKLGASVDQCAAHTPVPINNSSMRMIVKICSVVAYFSRRPRGFISHYAYTHGCPAIHIASLQGNLGAVQVLLAHDADPNCRSPRHGMTPLHLASMAGHNSIARALLDAGADADAVDRHGLTPAHWPASRWSRRAPPALQAPSTSERPLGAARHPARARSKARCPVSWWRGRGRAGRGSCLPFVSASITPARSRFFRNSSFFDSEFCAATDPYHPVFSSAPPSTMGTTNQNPSETPRPGATRQPRNRAQPAAAARRAPSLPSPQPPAPRGVSAAARPCCAP